MTGRTLGQHLCVESNGTMNVPFENRAEGGRKTSDEIIFVKLTGRYRRGLGVDLYI
jgi:hypothetical protein